MASSFVEYAYAAIVEGIAYDESIFRTDVVGFNMIHFTFYNSRLVLLLLPDELYDSVGFRNFVSHCVSVVSKFVFLKRNKPAPKLC